MEQRRAPRPSRRDRHRGAKRYGQVRTHRRSAQSLIGIVSPDRKSEGTIGQRGEQKRVFSDRSEAGRELALDARLPSGDDLVVLGLPRGGVPVAAEVASALNAPLDVIVVRKIGYPGHDQLAMGAAASGGVVIRNKSIIQEGMVGERTFARGAARALGEVERYEKELRGDRTPLELEGKTVIVVDDGIATGATVKAAIAALRQLGPESVIVATPVAPADTIKELEGLADWVVCLSVPSPFGAVGAWYRDFPQVAAETVRKLLEEPPESATTP